MVNHKCHQNYRSTDELPKLGDLFMVSWFEAREEGSNLAAREHDAHCCEA